MIVTNATMFQGNPYHGLIYSALEGQFEAIKGTFDDAVGRARRNESKIMHVHWEENPLRKCSSVTEARLVTQRLRASLEEFKRHGGKLVWTLHNRLPHELEFTDELMELRQALAEQSDRVLVHSTAALAALREQADVAMSRYMLFPHPSYAGAYPRTEMEDNVNRGRHEFLFFGLLREYKGLDFLAEAVDPVDTISPDLQIHVRGDVLPNDPYADRVKEIGHRRGFDLQIGRVPDEAVGWMFSSVRAALIPYTRFLTSGVAMLALTYGTPIVAPDTPQMRELLPPENHPLLYPSGEVEALREVLRKVVSMDEAGLQAIIAANIKRAETFHPRRVSTNLGALYASLLQ